MTSPLNCPSRLRAVSSAVLAAAFVMAQPAQGAERAAQAKPSGKKVASAAAGNAAALNALKQQIEAMRLQYEARLKVLEDKLDATPPLRLPRPRAARPHLR
jgi:aspartate/methionine/tyrosine aminotransferase